MEGFAEFNSDVSRVLIRFLDETEIRRLDTTMVEHLDPTPGESVIGWLQLLKNDELRRYESLALDIALVNWSHERVVHRIYEIAKLFVGSRSTVTLLTILIELGQLVRDMTFRAKNQPVLRDIVGSYSNAMTKLMKDAEKSMYLNRRVEDLTVTKRRKLDTITE